jgi:prephenate dehydrogenase
MKFAGKGFIDTSRVASGPSNIWMDIFLSNAQNISGGLAAVIEQLSKLKDAMDQEDSDKIKQLLEKARQKRSKLIDHKIKNKELI